MSYFESVKPIQYEGPKSNNPLAFKFYNPEEKIGDKTMEEILRFSVAYWHTFVEELSRLFFKYLPVEKNENTPNVINATKAKIPPSLRISNSKCPLEESRASYVSP